MNEEFASPSRRLIAQVCNWAKYCPDLCNFIKIIFFYYVSQVIHTKYVQLCSFIYENKFTLWWHFYRIIIFSPFKTDYYIMPFSFSPSTLRYCKQTISSRSVCSPNTYIVWCGHLTTWSHHEFPLCMYNCNANTIALHSVKWYCCQHSQTVLGQE